MKLTLLSKSAFTLVEVTLALGVAGFCLIALFGLLPVGLNSNQTSIEQTAANNLLSAFCADLRATPLTMPRGVSATSIQYGVGIPASPTASAATSGPYYFSAEGQKVPTAAAARYAVNVTFLPNGTAKSATLATIKITWPPQAVVPVGSVQTFLALDRN